MKVIGKNKVSDIDLSKTEQFILNNCLDKDMTFSSIRAGLNMTIKELPDGYIHQAAINAGFEVSG